jgi:hypothetical protein
METKSPLRPKFHDPEGVYLAANGFPEQKQEDELRMKVLLNSALDSKDAYFHSPIPRASSTPPVRLNFAYGRHSNVPDIHVEEAFRNLNVNEVWLH